jgi:hypothetical protein
VGLFQHKKEAHKQTPEERATDAVEQLFDDEFREEMRARARSYFDRVVNENAALFKQDLDATVAHINTELKQHAARQLDDQLVEIAHANSELKEDVTRQLKERFDEYDKTIKSAENAARDSITRSNQTLQEQYQQLNTVLQKNIARQDTMMMAAFDENKTRIAATKDAQDAALQWLNRSAQALQDQHQQLSNALQQSVVRQEEMLVTAFEENMARIVEHYLLGALGDQYDMKAQLPSIIKQMEANKQAIVDDMKL